MSRFSASTGMQSFRPRRPGPRHDGHSASLAPESNASEPVPQPSATEAEPVAVHAWPHPFSHRLPHVP